jgi:hypothetical protein
MRLSMLLMLCMVALLISPTLGNPPTPPPELYGVCSESECLYMIEYRGDGHVEEIGDLGPPGRFSACTSMAVDWDGNAYTVNNSTGELLLLNRVNGEATVVATGVGKQDALAISRDNLPGPGNTTIPAGALFGATDRLVTIDRTTGNITVIGSIGRPVAGLVFWRDTLYGAEAGGHNRLVTISTETGVGTVVGTIGPNVGRLGSLAYQHGSGGGRGGGGVPPTLWGSDVEAGTIFPINAETGEVGYAIQLPNGYRAEGLEFAHWPVAVEPSTWGAIKSQHR